MRIRSATARDMEAIAAMWPEDVFGPVAEMARSSSWWAVIDGAEVVAYSSARLDSHGDAVLMSAWVDPRHRGHGIHARMIRARVRWAKSVGAGRVSTYTWGGNLPSMRALIRARFVMVSRTWDGSHSWITWSREL
jgi:RimJ/RimL family protein N-acetyltransferase